MYLFMVVLIIVFLGIPLLLTLFNIYLLFTKKYIKEKIVLVNDILTFALGISYTILWWIMQDYNEWNVQLYTGQGEYTPISYQSMPTFLTLCCIAIAGYVVLRFLRNKLSPILASLCYGGIFMGFCLTIVLTIQLFAKTDTIVSFLLLLFAYNFVLCSVRLIRDTALEFSQKLLETNYENKVLQLCKRLVSGSVSYVTFSFLLSVPMLILAIIILMLFGQQPDSFIKMFTETADWTLSQKIPPPRLDYEGHYLCTVAACGDEKVVKPLRAGKRHNELIVVNRQLLVANAFEDLIAEKTPTLHKIVRNIYDRVGLPVSKYINTKRRSNLVYFIMKPLEWLFVFCLYFFDKNPEDRIHKQYLG